MNITKTRWTSTSMIKPTEGEVVETKISDPQGERNVQKLIYKNNLWWHTDMSMYVYYTPTHWRYVDNECYWVESDCYWADKNYNW